MPLLKSTGICQPPTLRPCVKQSSMSMVHWYNDNRYKHLIQQKHSSIQHLTLPPLLKPSSPSEKHHQLSTVEKRTRILSQQQSKWLDFLLNYCNVRVYQSNHTHSVIILQKALDPQHYPLYECLNKHIKEKGKRDAYTQIFF